MPRSIGSPWVLVGTGLVSGLFAAFFGVGGGLLIIPLLILVAGFGEREATGTSLAIIGITAGFAVLAFVVLGEVEWAEAALVGVPAVAGTFFGTWLQQRISSRLLVLLFSAFLVLIASELLVR